MTREQVRELAKEGRVRVSDRYHAQTHWIRFDDIRAALVRCVEVRQDLRTNVVGDLRHPRGYISYGRMPPDRFLRVDFDLDRYPNGPVLSIVTAFWVKR